MILDRSKLGDGSPAIHQFFNSPFRIILNLLARRRLTKKNLNSPKAFQRWQVKFCSSCWSIYFSDCIDFFWKPAGGQLPLLKKSFENIWEACRPIGRKGRKLDWLDKFCLRFFSSKHVPKPPDSYPKEVFNINLNSLKSSNLQLIPRCGPPAVSAFFFKLEHHPCVILLHHTRILHM